MRQDADRARAKELFRQMSLKEKCVHVFRYHWLHMVIAVVLLFGSVILVQDVRHNIAMKKCLYIVMQDGYETVLQPEVEALAREAGWPEEMNFLTCPSGEVGGDEGMRGLLYLTADQVDFIICDEITSRDFTMDDMLDLVMVPLEETPLGERVEFNRELFVIALRDTGRAEKVEQFMPMLMGAMS